jgi:hypothetical protein
MMYRGLGKTAAIVMQLANQLYAYGTTGCRQLKWRHYALPQQSEVTINVADRKKKK